MKNYCTVYLVRHGETEWNVKSLVQGHTDVPLNKKGVAQAKELAEKLRHIHFNAVFSSDLVRAKRTAEIIALEKKITVSTTKVLRERFFGRLEGKSWRSDTGELMYLWERLATLTEEERRLHRLQKVENNEQLMKRFIPFLREVAVVHPGKTVLIVSHGGIIRAFLIHLGWATNRTLPAGSIQNLAFIKLLSDGVDFFLERRLGWRCVVKYSYMPHLPECENCTDIVHFVGQGGKFKTREGLLIKIGPPVPFRRFESDKKHSSLKVEKAAAAGYVVMIAHSLLGLTRIEDVKST